MILLMTLILMMFFKSKKDKPLEEHINDALIQLEKEQGLYDINDFDVDKLKVDIKNDIEVLSEIDIIINKSRH